MIEPIREDRVREVIVVGGGIAGLSAAIYLGRAHRDVLVINSGRSMAVWEPHVENYLGFPDCISGEELLRRGKIQASKYEVEFIEDEIQSASKGADLFHLNGKDGSYTAKSLLLSTGIYHIPPDIPSVRECLGKSMFFCKDCDGYRVQGQRILIMGYNNEAVEYALGMLLYSSCVALVTNGHETHWDKIHENWISEYEIPIYDNRITAVDHDEGRLKAVCLDSNFSILADCLFTTRGDIYHNGLAKSLGANIDAEGEIIVNKEMRTNLSGLYAAGCVTPANCQMIIAAGEGATAAQTINRDLFEQSLRTHSLRRFRAKQISREKTVPEILNVESNRKR
jgi:thioredoxin reductase (NADPH)